MRSFLKLLDTIAVFLVVLLALAILFAVYAYRTKPRETLKPEDRTDV